jgi:hypothetical protein
MGTVIDIDLTNKIERLEVLEERLGVTLNSLSAFVRTNGEEHWCIVRGELQSKDSTNIQEDIQLMVAVYDSSGRIIGTDILMYLANNFFGLETFESNIFLPLSQVSKVRIYPKKW